MSCDWLQTQDLFLCGTNSKCADRLGQHVPTLSNQFPETISFIDALLFLFQEQVSFVSNFSRIFLLHVPVT